MEKTGGKEKKREEEEEDLRRPEDRFMAAADG